VVPVPRHWSDVTPAWLTRALGARLPGAVVGNVEFHDVQHGTNSRARVSVRYEHGEGPPSFFVKRSGKTLHRLALTALRAVATEARLAASGEALPIERPLPYAGGTDRRRLSAVVVMEDVTGRGARTNDATTALTVEEVRHGLQGLARLHAAYWNGRVPVSLGFLRPWHLGRAWAPVSIVSLRNGLRRVERSVPSWPDGARPDARTLARQFQQSAVLASTGEQTVLHGDPHPGNTYSLDGRTGFYDWQLARTGNWSHDVGYFIGASLDVGDRRRHERGLLAGYLERLTGAGAAAPDWDTAWERYRATPAFGLATWLHTISFGSLQPVEVCETTIARFAAAYDDLETARSAAAGDR
jgi:hypothetical protein